MFVNATVCVVYTTDGLSRTGSASTLGVWIANTVDPTCAAIHALRTALEKPGFEEFDIWSAGNGLRIRVETRTGSSDGIRKKAAALARLVRMHLGLLISISQLPNLAAVDRALA